MCQAIFYPEAQSFRKIEFHQPQAKLPVLLKVGGVMWLPWGRHQLQKGQLPLGGWARLNSIVEGKWDSFFPKPVKIPAQGFTEVDFEGQSHYFKLVKGQAVQGLLARVDQELRVYIVTITPERSDAVFARWPKII
jgi:hypothetical protein